MKQVLVLGQLTVQLTMCQSSCEAFRSCDCGHSSLAVISTKSVTTAQDAHVAAGWNWCQGALTPLQMLTDSCPRDAERCPDLP
ncbi:hypothetical protein TREES_T100000215 [Tupaia chinensis]|uniref:Uncharacterized protein n=1 Tax=Tupaia chinensis TaxID=246437 RepID=L9L8T9_TUPCH|nr:hypothetical protein TREES_T100000215 [Tupaia chinensis]